MGTRDPSAKKTMLDIAADYDRLAKKSEESARRPGGKRNRYPTRLLAGIGARVGKADV